MSFKLLKAHITYWRKARYRNGHGVHSPFMYELVRNVFSAKKTPDEPRNKQERIMARLNVFCKKHNLQLVQIKVVNDFLLYNENCIAILAQPHVNTEIWKLLAENANTQVTADCWHFGLALAVTHLQKQRYIIQV